MARIDWETVPSGAPMRGAGSLGTWILYESRDGWQVDLVESRNGSPTRETVFRGLACRAIAESAAVTYETDYGTPARQRRN